jgi:hypothetical protein
VNVHDEMSDNEVLRAASESLSAISMAGPPDVEAILARGRAVRARRRIPGAASGLAMVTAAAAVLGLGLSGALSSAPAASARGTGTIRTAAFTLVEHANGTDTLTLNPREVYNAAALQNAFHQAGIPALVTSGSFCSSHPSLAAFSQVMYDVPTPHQLRTYGGGTSTVYIPTATINPAAMPAGTELSFGIFQFGPYNYLAAAELINTSSYSCTSTPPVPPAVPPAHEPPLVNGMTFRLFFLS